jgi:hypothetical protein
LPNVFAKGWFAARSPAASGFGTRPHVTEGRRYAMGDGEIEIESVTPIGFPDITPELARESGFLGVLDLLKVAKHGKGKQHLSHSISLYSASQETQGRLEQKIEGNSLKPASLTL